MVPQVPTLGSWADLRQQMPVAEQWAYFDHAAVAPLSLPARQAIEAFVADYAAHGHVRARDWNRRMAQCRRFGAKLVGADPDEIALVYNTTAGIHLVAEGYPWEPGDNVVILASEFPSNRLPWLNLATRGVEVREVANVRERLDLAEVAKACDARTRIVSASWVGYATGWRNDLDGLAEIAHRRGALFFVDAIQGLGMYPLDVQATPIDFFAADGHKWLLGPEGAGLFYVRREHLDRLRPLGVGWHSSLHAGDYSRREFELKPTAERYEGGSANLMGFAGLAASLELLSSFGPERIGERLIEITDEACWRLTAIGATIASCRDPGRASGILSFELPDRDPVEVRRHCLEQQVVLSCRDGRLRISPHAYTNTEDLERLCEVLESAP